MIRRSLRLPSIAALRRLSTTPAAAVVEHPEKGINREPRRNTRRSINDTLRHQLLGPFYQNGNSGYTLRKLKRQGYTFEKYELVYIVRQLMNNRRYKDAVQICEWMQTQLDMQLVPVDYAIHLEIIAKLRGPTGAEEFFGDIPEGMRDATTYTALLHTYVEYKESEKAEALMAKMSERGFLKSPGPYNHMLSLYLSLENFQKLSEMLQEVKKNTSPDIVTYNVWLTACASQNCVETAEKVFLELKKAKIQPDWVTYSTLANIYTKNSLKEKAKSMIQEAEKTVYFGKVRFAHESLISLHTGLEDKKGVWRMWNKIKSINGKVHDVEYTCMITSLLKLKETEEAEKLYTEWESISPSKNPRVPNVLLSNFIGNDQMEMAEAFHKRMVEKEIKSGYSTWVLFTWGYLKRRKLEKALDCFSNALTHVRRWDPDEKLVHEVCEVVEELGDVESAEKWLEIFRSAHHVNTKIYNSLLRTYAKAGKMPLVVAERMKKDNVEIDEETERLLQLTSKSLANHTTRKLKVEAEEIVEEKSEKKKTKKKEGDEQDAVLDDEKLKKKNTVKEEAVLSDEEKSEKKKKKKQKDAEIGEQDAVLDGEKSKKKDKVKEEAVLSDEEKCQKKKKKKQKDAENGDSAVQVTGDEASKSEKKKSKKTKKHKEAEEE